MNFNENFVDGSDPSQGVHRGRSFDRKERESYPRPKSENARKKEKPELSTLDWVSSTAKEPKELGAGTAPKVGTRIYRPAY